jgi:hypothetical protein
LAGNDKALALVRVPTEAEEQARARKRQRQQLRQQRLSLVAQGRSLMLARIAGRDVCGADEDWSSGNR